MKMSSINKVYIKHVSIHTLRLLHVVGKMATSDFLFNSSALSLFTVHLSHPYMTTGKTIALTRRTFVGKVISLHFNMLSRLDITFLPRSKHPLICNDLISKLVTF